MRPSCRRAPHATAASGLALTLLLLLGGTACTQERPPTPAPIAPALTTRQAELLALTRFTNYRRGTAKVTADIPVQGHTVQLVGRLDWRHSTGFAVLQGNGGAVGHGRHLLRWNRATVSVRHNWTSALPQSPPPDGWTQRGLTPSASDIDTTLLLLLNLAADRPDNPQLLVHSGARHLGQEKTEGVPVTVFAGPSGALPQAASREATHPTPGPGRTRYWIDANGRLRRFSARLGGSAQWLTAKFHG